MTINEAIEKLKEVMPKMSFCINMDVWRHYNEDNDRIKVEYAIWDGKQHYRAADIETAVTLCIQGHFDVASSPSAVVAAQENIESLSLVV